MCVRSAKIFDVSQLRNLLNRAYKPPLDMGLNFNATFQDDALTLKGLEDEGRVLIVEREAEIIATMKIRDINKIDTRKCLYVSRFAVRPDLQKFGLGTLLLQLAEKIAIRGRYECIQLDTAQSAKHLLEYYQAQGFKIARPIYYEGKTYTSWVLERPVDQTSVG